MRHLTRGGSGAAVVTLAAVALGAATYAYGTGAAQQARFTSGASGVSVTAPERPGRPSATGEDGRSPVAATPTPAGVVKRKPDTGGCPVGPHQREAEGYLAELGGFGPVTVDGRQSAADCRAIRKFQRRYGVQPPRGRAGPVTVDVARRLAKTRLEACDAASGTTVCLDLTHQTMWVVRDGEVVLGPTPVRTGRAGLATPEGRYTVTEKKRHTISSYYKVPLPYWQRFVGDIGFHETPSYLHRDPGSHGCVNLLHRDAVGLWKLTSVGTPVHSFGRKPGT